MDNIPKGFDEEGVYKGYIPVYDEQGNTPQDYEPEEIDYEPEEKVVL